MLWPPLPRHKKHRLMLHTIPLRQKITVMLAVMSGLLLAALDQTIIITALSRIVEDFNSYESLSWIVTAYLITTTITVPIVGKLSDIFGRRNVLLVGVGIFTLASLLSGMSQNIGWLIAARALQGVGGGILTSSAFTIIGDLFTPKERGKWQGIIGAVFGLSSVIGPLLGGYLTDPHNVFGLTTDWRWTFYINIPVGIVAFYLIAVKCPNFTHEVRQKIDFRGAGLLAVAITAIIFAAENTGAIFAGFIETTGISAGALKAAFAAIGILFTVLFILAERRAEAPIFSLRMFKRPVFRISIPIVFLFGIAFLGAILYLTQFLQQVLRASPTESGLMLLPMIVGLSVTSLASGRIVSTTGRYKWLLITGTALTALGILSLAFLDTESTYVDVAWRMVLTGLGLGSGLPIFNLIIQNEAPQRELGMATASVQLSRSLGSTIGTAFLGGILTAGVAANLSAITAQPFVQTVRQNPAASQIIGDEFTADTALQLNSVDTQRQIESGIRRTIGQSPLPEAAKQQALDQALADQQAFSNSVKQAFADAIRPVFYYAAAVMGIAFVLGFFIREIPIRDTHEDLSSIAPAH